MKYILKKWWSFNFFFLFIVLPLVSHSQQTKVDELIKLAIAQIESGENDQAIANLSSALAIDHESKWAYTNRGVAYANKDSYDLAIADYNKVIELDQKYTIAYINRGIAYSNKENYDQAIADYNKAIELNPKDARAYYGRGGAYLLKGVFNQKKRNKKQEADDYNKALKLDSNSNAYIDRKGFVDYNKGSYEQPLADYNKTKEPDPEDAIAYFKRGNIYYNKGSYDLAIADYDKAIELMPKYADPYDSRGFVYYTKGNFDQAMADYNRAIELDPKCDQAYSDRGLIYFQKGLYNNALSDYKTCLNIAPLNKYALLNILPCLIRLEQFDEADSYYKKYNNDHLKGYIESSGWEFYKLYLKAATEDASSARYDEALTTIKTAEATYTSNTKNNKDANAFAKSSYADVLALKGYILLKLSRPEEARDAYNQALVIISNQPDVQAALRNINSLGITEKKETVAKKDTPVPLDLPLLENTTSAPKYYAILIAEEKYSDKNFDSLFKPKEDALELKHLLETKYTFQPNNIDTLFNRRREDILSAISNKCNTLSENDNLLIFYSGHGTAKKDMFNKTLGYLVPSSAEKDNWFTYISTDDLVLALGGKGTTKHILFVVDACFAGALMKEITDAPRDINNAYNLPSRHILTSTNETPVPDNSVFLHYFTKRLEENKKKYITGNDIYVSLFTAVKDNSQSPPQYRVIANTGHEGGDFVFIKK